MCIQTPETEEPPRFKKGPQSGEAVKAPEPHICVHHFAPSTSGSTFAGPRVAIIPSLQAVTEEPKEDGLPYQDLVVLTSLTSVYGSIGCTYETLGAHPTILTISRRLVTVEASIISL